jgi:hypothetical protein
MMVGSDALKVYPRGHRLQLRFPVIGMNSRPDRLKLPSSLEHLSRGVVAHGANQLFGANSWSKLNRRSSGSFVFEIPLIVPAKIKHTTHGIEPVAAQLKSANVVRGTCGMSTVRQTLPVDPMQARVSEDDAFTKEYSKIEDHIETSQISYPRDQVTKEDLYRLLLIDVSYERTAIAGQPGRHRGKPRLFKRHGDVEFCQKGSQRVQALFPMLHEMTEILFATSPKLPRLLVGQIPWTMRPLPVRRLIDGIIDESLRHAPPLVDEMLRFLPQPAEHSDLQRQTV